MIWAVGWAVAPLGARGPFAVLTGQPNGGLFATPVDGPASSAVIGTPQGLALEPSGNLVFGDGNTLRRADLAGRVTTLTTVSGPIIAVVVDGAGNIYFSNLTGGTVHRYTPAGALSTYASGLASPRGLALDGQGRLYVADATDHVIYRLGTDGSKTLYAGTRGVEGSADGAPGATPAPSLGSRLHGLVFDAAGNLYIADQLTIRKVAPNGTLSTLAGNPGASGFADGRGSAATFTNPLGLAIDAAGNLLVADSSAGLVRQVDPSGLVTTLARVANATANPAGALTLSGQSPVAVAVNAGSGGIYLLDYHFIEVSAATAGRDTRLANLSARAFAGGGGNGLIAGFAVSGGGGTKNVLVRGIGPTLTGFGVADALPAAALDVYDAAPTRIASGTNWGGSPVLAEQMRAVGAFALPANSADAAFLKNFAAGAFSVQLSGQGGATGIALAELYDADPAGSTARLVNLSSRAQITGGARDLIAGFVIVGPSSLKVLIRGVGPGLAPFGVPGALPAAQITVFNAQGGAVASNARWESTAGIASVFTQVGAFALPAGSADAAVVLTLNAGAYTVQLSGAGGATGVGLVEIYEVP